jgi:hypothetical protein
MFQQEAADMEFTLRNLSVLAYAQGFTLWHYKAPGAKLSALGARGFFDLASDMLASGDMVLMSAEDGGRLAFAANQGQAVHLAAVA